MGIIWGEHGDNIGIDGDLNITILEVYDQQYAFTFGLLSFTRFMSRKLNNEIPQLVKNWSTTSWMMILTIIERLSNT